MPHRDSTLLDQISYHRFSAILAQLCIHVGIASRVGVTHYLDDVPNRAGSGLRELLKLLLVRRRDFSASHRKFHGCLALHVIFAQRGKALSVLPDILEVLFDFLLVGLHILLVGLHTHLVARDTLLVGLHTLLVGLHTLLVGRDTLLV